MEKVEKSKLKYTILVLSCRNFSDLWSNNLSLFDKYFNNHPSILLSSDGEGIYDVTNPKELMVFDGGMSTRIIKALKSITDDYVLLTFDDYFLKGPVKTSFLEDIIAKMEMENIDYCRFFKNKKVKGPFLGKEKYKNLPLKSVYEINFYPALWKKDSLLSLLKEEEDIWKTEVRLTRRAREQDYKAIAIYNSSIFPFVDIVRKGKYLKSGYHFLKKNNLYISNRKVRTMKETLYLFAQTFISDHMPSFLKEKIKAKMRKKGKVYYSDFENSDD